MFTLVLSTISISVVFIVLIIIRSDFSLSKNLLIESYLLLKNINFQLTTDLKNFELVTRDPDIELSDCLTLHHTIEILQDVRQLFLNEEVNLQVENANTGAQIEKLNQKIVQHISQHLKIREAYELLKNNYNPGHAVIQNKAHNSLHKLEHLNFN